MAHFWLAGQIILMQLWDKYTIENTGTSQSSNLQCYAERQACCYQAGHIRTISCMFIVLYPGLRQKDKYGRMSCRYFG